MRGILASAVDELCATRRNLPGQKETWHWNDEVAKAVAKKSDGRGLKAEQTDRNKFIVKVNRLV